MLWLRRLEHNIDARNKKHFVIMLTHGIESTVIASSALPNSGPPPLILPALRETSERSSGHNGQLHSFQLHACMDDKSSTS